MFKLYPFEGKFFNGSFFIVKRIDFLELGKVVLHSTWVLILPLKAPLTIHISNLNFVIDLISINILYTKR